MQVSEPSAKYMAKAAEYKLTEAGLIPASWNCFSISDVAKTSSGTTPLRAMRERYFDNGTIPWVKTLDLNNAIIHQTDEHVTPNALKECSLQRYPAGTVLVAMYGGYNQIGRTGLLTTAATINQALTAITPDGEKLDSRYLLQNLNYKVEYWKSVASSSRKDPNITGKDVRDFPVAVPPLKEQQAIATALSDTDALIDALEQLLAKKRQVKQGAMQELLTGKVRLDGFSSPWVKKKIADLAEIRSGGTPNTARPEFWDGTISWCTPTDITALKGRKYLGSTSRKITPRGLKGCSAELIPANSIVMTSRATIGECAITRESVSTNQGFKNITPYHHIDVDFLYYALLTQTQGFLRLCSGSTFLEISKNQLATYEITTPTDKAEQIAIAAILSDMDTDITELETRLGKVRQVKQGMMRELLTGRTRLV